MKITDHDRRMLVRVCASITEVEEEWLRGLLERYADYLQSVGLAITRELKTRKLEAS